MFRRRSRGAVRVRRLTSFIGNHGLVAVFVLMAVAAVLPAASELTMIYGGALASGSLAGHIALGSHVFRPGFHAYLAVVVAGVLGNTLGAIGGWAVGFYGGHPLLERHGRLLHVSPARLDRAERWFAHFGRVAVPLGLATPLIRSFVAIPAGIAEVGLRRFVPLAIAGIAVFCAALAGLGWAVGANWHTARHDVDYVEYALVAGILLLAAYLVVRWRRSTTMARRASDTPR
jgi:membrane protein DedA with SNARE-associated domain